MQTDGEAARWKSSGEHSSRSYKFIRDGYLASSIIHELSSRSNETPTCLFYSQLVFASIFSFTIIRHRYPDTINLYERAESMKLDTNALSYASFSWADVSAPERLSRCLPLLLISTLVVKSSWLSRNSRNFQIYRWNPRWMHFRSFSIITFHFYFFHFFLTHSQHLWQFLLSRFSSMSFSYEKSSSCDSLYCRPGNLFPLEKSTKFES